MPHNFSTCTRTLLFLTGCLLLACSGPREEEQQDGPLTLSMESPAVGALVGHSFTFSGTVAPASLVDRVWVSLGEGAYREIPHNQGSWSTNFTLDYTWRENTLFVAVTATDGSAVTNELGIRAEVRCDPGDGENNDNFGCAVALSGDGGTLACGSYLHSSGQGAVYVYTNSGTGWVQSGKLIASDAAASSYLGASVAISSNGSLIAAGAYGRDIAKGAVYVYQRPEHGWVDAIETARLDAADGNGGYLGKSVALSSDGNTLAAGASYYNGGLSQSGAVYVYQRSGGWTTGSGNQVALLSNSAPESGAWLGSSVAISADGTTVLAGALGNNIALLFEKGTTWQDGSQQAILTNSGSGASSGYGTSVALNQDGSLAVVGDSKANGNTGAVFLFTREGGWASGTESAVLSPSDAASGDYFGASVAMAADGSWILVGAPRNDDRGDQNGTLYVFRRPGSSWISSQEDYRINNSDGAPDQELGCSIATDTQGDIMAAGASGGSSRPGSAYLYRR